MCVCVLRATNILNTSLPGNISSTHPCFIKNSRFSSVFCGYLCADIATAPLACECRATVRRDAETPADKACSIVVSVSHEPHVAGGVVKALRDSGLSGEALLLTVRALAGGVDARVGKRAGMPVGCDDRACAHGRVRARAHGRVRLESARVLAR